jgi:hypothetical protein
MLGLSWCVTTAVAQPKAQQTGPSYITFTVPGSALGVWVVGINNSMTVVGFYFDINHVYHCYVRSVSGSITSCDPPASVLAMPIGINAAGEVGGFYDEATGPRRGFIRSPTGTLSLFDIPGTAGTVTAINDRGEVTGYYTDTNTAPPLHGYVRSPEGKFTSFDVPGSTETEPASINAAGEITGTFFEGSSLHGFVRSPQGKFTSFDVPSSSTSGATTPIAINQKATITGGYGDLNGTYGLFVRDPHGEVTTFSVGLSSYASSINSSGAITGSYSNHLPPVYHGFVRSPQGTIAVFDVPGTSGTGSSAINDLGVIAGVYYPPSVGYPTAIGGFIRLPGTQEYELQPGTYSITDGRSLYVDGGFYLYGDPTVRLWVYVAGNPSQHWTFTKVAGGFTMLNQGTGQYANDVGGQLVEGPLADVWTVDPAPGGYTLKNNRTGLLLIDPGVQNGAITLAKKGSAWQLSPIN